LNRANKSKELINLHNGIKSDKKHLLKTDLHLKSIVSARSTHNIGVARQTRGRNQ